MNGTSSKFVEILPGAAPTITGNVGGSAAAGANPNLLAAPINLGEVGPSNASDFVKATVPLKLRSNTNYSLSVSSTVTSTATGANAFGAADIGFGLAAPTRSGVGVATGTDANQTAGDPTSATSAINATTGRFEFTATRSNLSAFTAATPALTGPQIMNAVPRSNANGLLVDAIFAVKPQFYTDGTVTAAVTFTISAP